MDPTAAVPNHFVPGSSHRFPESSLAGCLALLAALAVLTAAQADQLPEAKRVALQLAANGLPVALQGFAPRTPDIVPHESGCGMLEARAPDGREAVIVFDPGSDEAWGGVLLYIISGPAAEVLEWGGDPDPAPCRTGPSDATQSGGEGRLAT